MGGFFFKDLKGFKEFKDSLLIQKLLKPLIYRG